MLNIEVIKFEAQDVITASVAAPVETKPACTHSRTEAAEHIHPVHGFHDGDRACGDCGTLVWCQFDGKLVD